MYNNKEFRIKEKSSSPETKNAIMGILEYCGNARTTDVIYPTCTDFNLEYVKGILTMDAIDANNTLEQLRKTGELFFN